MEVELVSVAFTRNLGEDVLVVVIPADTGAQSLLARRRRDGYFAASKERGENRGCVQGDPSVGINNSLLARWFLGCVNSRQEPKEA